MVVVTGSWEPSNQSGKHTRRFIETFFLMRGSRQHTFYIQNDIMYILQNNPPDFSEGISLRPFRILRLFLSPLV